MNNIEIVKKRYCTLKWDFSEYIGDPRRVIGMKFVTDTHIIMFDLKTGGKFYKYKNNMSFRRK